MLRPAARWRNFNLDGGQKQHITIHTTAKNAHGSKLNIGMTKNGNKRKKIFKIRRFFCQYAKKQPRLKGKAVPRSYK